MCLSLLIFIFFFLLSGGGSQKGQNVQIQEMESTKWGFHDSGKEAEETNLPFVIKYFRNVDFVTE